MGVGVVMGVAVLCGHGRMVLARIIRRPRRVSQARCVRVLRIRFVRCIESISQACLTAARTMQRDDSAGAQALSQREGLTHRASKQLIKSFSTAIYLDSGSAISPVLEAVQHFGPILRYVALSDVPL